MGRRRIGTASTLTLTRGVTIRSVADPKNLDAVKFARNPCPAAAERHLGAVESRPLRAVEGNQRLADHFHRLVPQPREGFGIDPEAEEPRVRHGRVVGRIEEPLPQQVDCPKGRGIDPRTLHRRSPSRALVRRAP
jgi:hypothetical protein